MLVAGLLIAGVYGTNVLAQDATTTDLEIPPVQTPLTLMACEDGEDNDGDGLVDMEDPGCADASDNDEADPVPTTPAPALPLDTDGDGIEDVVDNCTDLANPDQADTDGDSIGDACEVPDGREQGDGNSNDSNDDPEGDEEVAGSFFGSLFALVNEPEPDQCGESHTYTFSSKNNGDLGDDSSKPANIDYINTGAPGVPDRLTVTADSGFEITRVEVSVDDDNQNGFVQIATGPITNFNPAGTEINVTKVTVKKVCPDVCPNIQGDQYEIPEGMTVDGNGQCVALPTTGHIIIEKQTNPDGSAQSFEFNPSWSQSDFSLVDNGQHDSGELNPGKYEITESVVSGWALTDPVVCTGQMQSVVTPFTGGVEIDLVAGETVTCVFTNVEDAGPQYENGITVFKSYDINGDGVFANNDEPNLGGWTFRLYDDAWSQVGSDQVTPPEWPRTVSFGDLEPGNYHLCEVVQDSWSQTYVESHPIAGAFGTITPSGSASAGEEGDCLSFAIDEDDNLEARFGNVWDGARIIKFLDSNGDGEYDNNQDSTLGNWTFRMYDSAWAQLDEGSTAAAWPNYLEFLDLEADETYYFCEVLPEGWAQTGIVTWPFSEPTPIGYGTTTANGSSATDEGDLCYVIDRSDYPGSIQLAFGNAEDDGSPQCEPDAEWMIVSDEETIVDGDPAFAVTTHPSWTSIPGAIWIWDEQIDGDGSHPAGTKIFTRTFDIGGTPLGATLQLSADNGYLVELNGEFLCEDDDPQNWSSVDTCIIADSDLMNGENTLTFTVENYDHASPNPGGLIYKLTVNENECEVPNPDHQCIPGEELILNGSFETPLVTHAALWDTFDSGTSGLEWLVDWVTGVVGPDPASLELHRGVAGWVSSDGSQHAELDGDTEGPDGSTSGEEASTRISQTIPTVPGETYTLSFEFSPRPGTSATENVLEIFWDGVEEDEISADGSANGNTDWTTHTYSFEATDWFTELAFEDAGTANSVGTFLDDVSLRCVEPDKTPDTPILTLIKQTVGGGDDTFSFVLDGVTSTSTDITTDGGSGSIEIELGVGTTTVTELFESDWNLIEPVECQYYNNSVGVSIEGGKEIYAEEGDHITCTFINEFVGENGGGDQSGTVEGYKWNDAEPNGQWDTETESGLQGWVIQLFDGDTLVDSDVTESDGSYSITYTPGNYTLCEVQQSGWTQTFPDDADNCHDVTIVLNATILDQNFGNHQEPLIQITSGGDDDDDGNPGSRRRSFGGGGEVLGATTETNFCPFLRDYQHINFQNDPEEVNKAKAFFNSYLGKTLSLDGIFDQAMFDAVWEFQNMFQADVLNTWAEQYPGVLDGRPTGYLYQTTKWKINSIICPGYETFPDHLVIAPGTTVR